MLRTRREGRRVISFMRQRAALASPRTSHARMQVLGRSGRRMCGPTWRLPLVAVAALMCVSAGLVPSVAFATITAANDAGYVESFAPVADAYIRSDSPTTNFSDANLRVKGADPGTRSYLQFQVG